MMANTMSEVNGRTGRASRSQTHPSTAGTGAGSVRCGAHGWAG
jgi:hypothetical protein